MDWVDSHDARIIAEILSEVEGLFFVEDAGEAIDQEGRKIIAAQDFVSSYKVKSVFGTGGVYPNGQMIVGVVFCRDSFARAQAVYFLSLIQSFKGETTSLTGSATIFSDKKNAQIARFCLGCSPLKNGKARGLAKYSLS